MHDCDVASRFVGGAQVSVTHGKGRVSLQHFVGWLQGCSAFSAARRSLLNWVAAGKT